MKCFIFNANINYELILIIYIYIYIFFSLFKLKPYLNKSSFSSQQLMTVDLQLCIK